LTGAAPDGDAGALGAREAMAMDDTAGAKPRKRDPERTRARLLDVATREFADHGFEGARVDRIVRAARVTPRMLYHYFGSKERLYLDVLDAVYAEIRAGERDLDLDAGDPVDAMRRLVGFTFDFFQKNRVFVRITRGENMLGGRYLRRSQMIRDMSQPLIDQIDRLLARGVAEGAFRAGVDALQLYVSIVALSVHHLNNAATLSAVFGRELSDRAWIAERRAHAVVMALRHVGVDAVEDRTLL
jgi:AcrR family transcriptional regulator